MIDIHLEQIAKVHEFEKYVIPCADGTYDYSWIKNRGEIIVTVKCEDGVILLVLLNPKRD